MKILIIGGGGREHALAWSISASPLCDELIIAPGNPGIAKLGRCVDIPAEDTDRLARLAGDEGVDLVIVGPEVPLVAGLVDRLVEAGIPAFGPRADAAQLEGSKAFARDFCDRHAIPQPRWQKFQNIEQAKAFAADLNGYCVIKADGLAAGKGVIIAQTRNEAEAAVRACFDGAFGAAGSLVVIEEFLTGEEISCFALCDGTTYRWLGSAQDHKRVGEGDTGPNTGGMGAYTPAPCLTPALETQVRAEIIEPSLQAMVDAGTPFQGILFAGIMLTPSGPQLLEYNVRFGDPEAQVILPLLGAQALDLFHAAATGQLAALAEDIALGDGQHALTVVMATQGYPGAYEKGSTITLPDTSARDVIIYHAGTQHADDGGLRAVGGRVLTVTGLGASLTEARDRAYAAVDSIQWSEGFFRRDIGWRALTPSTD